MRQLEAHEEQMVKGIKPIIERVLLVTVGTQYFSTSQLNAMHNPYRIGGRPPIAAGIVNNQTGMFFQSMRAVGPSKTSTMVVMQLFSDNESRASFLDGTENAIRRPYAALIRERCRAGVIKHLGEEVKSQVKIRVN